MGWSGASSAAFLIASAGSSCWRSMSTIARCRAKAVCFSCSAAPNAEGSERLGCHVPIDPKTSAACRMHCTASRFPWPGCLARATSSSRFNRRNKNALSVIECTTPSGTSASICTSSIAASCAAIAANSLSSAACKLLMASNGSAARAFFLCALSFSIARFLASTASVKLKR